MMASNPGFFGRFKKTQARKNSRIPKKKLKQISQKLKNRPTMMTEYHLIFSQFIRKSTCLTGIGFFALKFNYLTTNCLFCSAFEYKNSTLIPKPFMKHQKLKKNHQKLKHFPKKTQGKSQKTQESANSSWDGLANFGQKKSLHKHAFAIDLICPSGGWAIIPFLN